MNELPGITGDVPPVRSMTSLSSDAPGWAHDLNDNIIELHAQILAQREDVKGIAVAIEKTVDIVDKVQKEIAPLLERLEKHPMVKMLIGGKK